MSAQHPIACIYRPMTPADLPAPHELSMRLKWPHRLEDWALMQRAFKGFVALEGEQLIGTAFACPQGAFATIGLGGVLNQFARRVVALKRARQGAGRW